MSRGVCFPTWVAFNADGFPVAFARADYFPTLEALREGEEPDGPWSEGKDIRLVTDWDERDRLLDMHKGSTS